jgi:photosystem II stability/assembly factor-like uncharacterized protein
MTNFQKNRNIRPEETGKINFQRKNLSDWKLWVFLLSGPFSLFAQAPIKIFTTSTQASFRGLSVVDDSVVWVSGSQGTVGRTVTGGRLWQFHTVPGMEKADLRTLFAFDSLNALIGNAGSPAVLLRTIDGGKTWKEVYRNAHPDAFLDGVDFWDENRGMVYGDPINRRLLLLKTTDAGQTWLELPEAKRPLLDSGEASFAASGTNIRGWGKSKVLIATGGWVSRIWFSENEGQSWKNLSVPILQGKASEGIFSVAVQDKTWMVVGGDYLADTLRKQHIYYSANEGQNWTFPKEPTLGYRESVEFIKENIWLSTGPSGTEQTLNGGVTWQSISKIRGFHVLRKARKGKTVFLAGGKGLLGRMGE